MAERKTGFEAVDPVLLNAAMEARDKYAARVHNKRFVVLIDYRKPSSEERFILLDLKQKTAESLLVAHGQGSDPDHDGVAEMFSNTPNSRMTSLGAFVTGATYYGQHGLSLRLLGLEKTNDKAEERAIVIHGADYVSSARDILGRSWGCPALSIDDARRIIPLIRNGVFVFAVGPEQDG